jgi:FtsH-binding integral membrane protein
VDPSELERRQSVLVHTALAASVGVYAVMLVWLGRGTLSRPAQPDPAQKSFWILAAIGLAQFAGAWWVGRRLLRSPRSGAGSRVRAFFLLRGAAAEAIGLFGLLAGFLAAPIAATITLFALSLIAMLASAPTRAAWEEARRRAGEP